MVISKSQRKVISSSGPACLVSEEGITRVSVSIAPRQELTLTTLYLIEVNLMFYNVLRMEKDEVAIS